MSKEQVLEQVLSLPRDEQEHLVEQILLNLAAPSPEEYERIWAEEAMRRYQELKSGKVKGIPLEDVLRNARSRLG